MNQQCKVCGEPAAGFHFGAFTCEGCKSFFGRTYNNLSSISECKNNGCCVINKKNRTSCKACRLRKCLMVGMSKSGSRYGRRSNWFKIHCLLQEQQQHQQQSQQPHQQPPLQHQHHRVASAKEWDSHSPHVYKLAEDNNNHPVKLPIGTHHAMPASFPHGNDVAAFWAARSSLLPPQHMPFLGAPFLPTGYQPRHFLMPFMQTTLALPPAPASSASSSSVSSSPPAERLPVVPEHRTPANATANRLGPVQEQPIDLSIRSSIRVLVKSEEVNEPSDVTESEDEDSDEEGAGDERDRVEVERVREKRGKTTTPLDLTTKT